MQKLFHFFFLLSIIYSSKYKNKDSCNIGKIIINQINNCEIEEEDLNYKNSELNKNLVYIYVKEPVYKTNVDKQQEKIDFGILDDKLNFDNFSIESLQQIMANEKSRKEQYHKINVILNNFLTNIFDLQIHENNDEIFLTMNCYTNVAMNCYKRLILSIVKKNQVHILPNESYIFLKAKDYIKAQFREKIPIKDILNTVCAYRQKVFEKYLKIHNVLLTKTLTIFKMFINIQQALFNNFFIDKNEKVFLDVKIKKQLIQIIQFLLKKNINFEFIDEIQLEPVDLISFRCKFKLGSEKKQNIANLETEKTDVFCETSNSRTSAQYESRKHNDLNINPQKRAALNDIDEKSTIQKRKKS